MINPTMSQSPCLVYLHQSRVIHLIFKHLCRSCRSAPGVEGTNKLTSSLMGVIKCFYYKIFGWRMSQVYWNGYLFLRNFIISFVCRFWLDRKKNKEYMRYFWPRDQYVDPDLEIDPDIWKGQVERCCIFRTFSNQRGFCMWFVAVIDKKKYPFYIAV